MKSITRISIILAALTAFAGSAYALPGGAVQSKFIPESTGDVSFDGILAIRSLSGGCSASLVRFEKSKDDDKAYVLTNGHCNEIGFIDPGTYFLDKKSTRTFKILDPKDGQKDIGSLKADRIAYATMTKTDITLYHLTSTYAEIASKYNVHPLTIASTPAAAGEKIEIASGYWRKGYACDIELVVPTLKEDKWAWVTSLRYSRPGCQTIGGTSGSPIVSAGTNTLVGINNTGNDNGEKCTLDNPCEVDRDGNITYVKGYSYGQQTYWITTCLDSGLNFDLSLEGCALPGGKADKTDSLRVL